MESRRFRRSAPSNPTERRRSGEPLARTAALMQQAQIPQQAKLLTSSRQLSWEKEVIQFDRDGPGILGYYLDMVALMASLCPLYVEVRDPKTGKFVRSDDPVLAMVLSKWRGNLPNMDQSELAYYAVRSRESIGRCWHVNDHEIGYCVVAVAQPEPGYLNWVTPYGVPRRTPQDRVYYAWTPDPYEPHKPGSPVRRSLPDLRRLSAMVRNQTRTANSRLLTNGLLAFDDEGGGNAPFAVAPNQRGGTDDDAELTGTDAVIDSYLEMAQVAWTDDSSPAANLPFPYKGKPAQHVDLGGDIDSGTLEAERAAIAGFARSVNFPQQLLTEGPGAANHWNEWLVQESAVRLGLSPKLNPLCADVSSFHLRPRVMLLSASLGREWRYAPGDVRVAADLSFLLSRPKQVSELIEAWRMGAVTRKEIRDALGVTDMLDIPAGMSEYEHWETANHVSGAPYAEVDAEGNLIVPPPPPDMGGGGISLGGGAPALPPADGGVGAPITEPPMPQLAALQPDQRTVDDRRDETAEMFAALTEADRRLESNLSTIGLMVATAADVEAAKAVLRSMPQGDDRTALRDMPAPQAWGKADDASKASVDTAKVFADVAERHRSQIVNTVQTEIDRASRAWPAVAPAFDDSTAERVADAFLVAALIWWLSKLGSTKTQIPVSAAREAMAVGAGATPTSEGTIQVSAGARPVPESGGGWRGNLGLFTGDKTVRLVDPDSLMRWRWVHGFHGEPETPFPPHVALDGMVFDSDDAVPGGLFIMDHHGCRCAMVPVPPK